MKFYQENVFPIVNFVFMMLCIIGLIISILECDTDGEVLALLAFMVCQNNLVSFDIDRRNRGEN